MNIGNDIIYLQLNTDMVKTFYMPSLGIDVQGAKLVTVGQEVYEYDGTMMHMVPIALPGALLTIQASNSKPFLGVRLELDPKRIAEWVLKVYQMGLHLVSKWSASYVTRVDINIV